MAWGVRTSGSAGSGWGDLRCQTPVLWRQAPSTESDRHYHHIFDIRERTTGHRLTEQLEMHTLEMLKFTKKLPRLVDDEEKWLMFLKRGHQMTASEVQSLGVPAIVDAEKKLSHISQDRILQMQVEQRRCAELDALSYAEDKWKAGVREGKREGKAEGKREGKAEGKAEAIVDILEVRGIALSSKEKETILTCQDRATLDAWLPRALHVSSAAELLSPP